MWRLTMPGWVEEQEAHRGKHDRCLRSRMDEIAMLLRKNDRVNGDREDILQRLYYYSWELFLR